MIRKILALGIVAAMHACGTAHAADVPAAFELTTKDAIVGAPAPTPTGAARSVPADEYVFFGVMATDMLQSLDIHRTAGLVETNKILGAKPSEAKIFGYFVAMAAAHWGITRIMLDRDVPTVIVHAWIDLPMAWELTAVKNNFSVGVHLYVP